MTTPQTSLLSELTAALMSQAHSTIHISTASFAIHRAAVHGVTCLPHPRIHFRRTHGNSSFPCVHCLSVARPHMRRTARHTCRPSLTLCTSESRCLAHLLACNHSRRTSLPHHTQSSTLASSRHSPPPSLPPHCLGLGLGLPALAYPWHSSPLLPRSWPNT